MVPWPSKNSRSALMRFSKSWKRSLWMFYWKLWSLKAGCQVDVFWFHRLKCELEVSWCLHSTCCVDSSAGRTCGSPLSSNRSVTVRASGQRTARPSAATPITTAVSVDQSRMVRKPLNVFSQGYNDCAVRLKCVFNPAERSRTCLLVLVGLPTKPGWSFWSF